MTGSTRPAVRHIAGLDLSDLIQLKAGGNSLNGDFPKEGRERDTSAEGGVEKADRDVVGQEIERLSDDGGRHVRGSGELAHAPAAGLARGGIDA